MDDKILINEGKNTDKWMIKYWWMDDKIMMHGW